ncbi:hypothetical protein ABIA71_002356 [Stenotrophomonas sp. 2619]
MAPNGPANPHRPTLDSGLVAMGKQVFESVCFHYVVYSEDPGVA